MSALLAVRGVSKRFGGLQALSSVTFGVGEREIVGIIGPNGAGKTTLFNVITGVYAPDAGRVTLRGTDVTGWAAHRICRLGAARTFQIGKPFAGLTVLQTVRIGALNRVDSMARATERALEVLDLVGLGAKRDELGRSLTVIERKRLELARALATGPALLLLDEVAAGLRPNEIQEMITLVRRIAAGGVSVLIIEHVLEAVMRLSARIVVLNYGEVIAEGTPRSLVNDARVIEAYLGEVTLDGERITGLAPSAIVERGLAHVPEGRQLFTNMTVQENLEMGAYLPRARAALAETLRRVTDLFPRLGERQDQLAGTLSGGEQQMLAIGRALMSRPRLLILDEPSLGLAPLMVRAIFDAVTRINAEGTTVLLVEQNLVQSLRLSHRGYVLETGRIVLEGTGGELLANPHTRQAFLGV